MPRTRVSSLVTEKVLSDINQTSNQPLMDAYLDGMDVGMTKNLCAKVSPALADHLDSVARFLGLSKRQFIEASIIDAIAQAEAIIEAEGLHEINLQRAEDQEAAA